MTIFYLSPGSPQTQSGGTRKLYDHVAILKNNGFDAEIVYLHQVANIAWKKRDIVVIPEVYGDGLDWFEWVPIPRGVRRVSFVQNGYLLDGADGHQYVRDPDNHPFTRTPDLVAIFTESRHTEDIIRARWPELSVPLIRTHSSGNGRNGQDAGFHYGEWPREKWVMSFEYKHASLNAQVFRDLSLPDGWEMKSLTGLSDEEIQVAMRTGAIFAACNINEGMCAPTQEAIQSGCVNVVWPGGPTGQTKVGGPMEYLEDRAVIAEQDNIEALRQAIVDTAIDIDANPDRWANDTAAWAQWHGEHYSRAQEIAETIAIFESFGCTRESEKAA